MESQGDGAGAFDEDADDFLFEALFLDPFPFPLISSGDDEESFDAEPEDDNGVELIHYIQGQMDVESPPDPAGPSGNVSDDNQVDMDVPVDHNVQIFIAEENGLVVTVYADDSHDNYQEVSNEPRNVQPEGEDSGGSFRWWDELSGSDRDEESPAENSHKRSADDDEDGNAKRFKQ